jgi:hypothetical protein
MVDREQFAAMAMQALITREQWSVAKTARQAVGYANALIEALDTTGPKPGTKHRTKESLPANAYSKGQRSRPTLKKSQR